MISIALQIFEGASLIGLLILIWRVSKWLGWRVRAVVYGWAVVFVWALFWAILLPILFSRIMSPDLRAKAFPDGTIAMAALVGGWVWPLIIVAISSYKQDRKR
ncbi:MAG TPA: hypothetical protein VHG89_03540 [Verrucomicrobiae bacterium]|nr:hypothetical protein [Verrucomicrobiae bacterium]